MTDNLTHRDISLAAISFLNFEPNEDQILLINALSAFICHHQPLDCFVLNGFAGTGKTSVMGALIKALHQAKIKTVTLAPTGRAAKVASRFSHNEAFTIHKKIFRGNSTDPSNNKFFLNENRSKDTIFIVDEASLISDGLSFNTSLLQQLITFIYSAPGCAMILVGDTAQLPPVGMTISPAMNLARLRQIGLNPISFTLKKPVRQAADSGILYNATVIRKILINNLDISRLKLFVSKFPDVETVDFYELPGSISDSWNSVGVNETIMITRSNKRANYYNKAIRTSVLYAEEPLEIGDRLIISKNDYFWSKENKLESFIANGETAVIESIGRKEKKYGRWFVDVELKLVDSDAVIAAKIMLRSLVTEGPSIPREEMQRFYNVVMSEYDGELSYKIKGVMNDEYFNALQVKYAYCVTCHKAQGGQWKHVYIDMSSITEENMGEDFLRWLYTATSRATEKLFLINPTINID